MSLPALDSALEETSKKFADPDGNLIASLFFAMRRDDDLYYYDNNNNNNNNNNYYYYYYWRCTKTRMLSSRSANFFLVSSSA